MKKYFERLKNRQFLCLIIWAFCLNLIIEILNRKSFLFGIEHMVFNTHIFIYNTLIILSTLSISVLFKKRYIIIFLVSVVWLGLGITNNVLLNLRNSPLSAIDFKIVKSALSIFTVYLNTIQLCLIGLAAVVLVGFIIFLIVKLPNVNPDYQKSVNFTFGISVTLFIFSMIMMNRGYLSRNFKEMGEAYKNYGFCYSFVCTMFDRGIERPGDYSENIMNNIKDEIDEDIENTDNKRDDESFEHPNIIFLQLESFFDVKHLKDLELSEDPIPIFTNLKNEYSSGFLSVPVVGGGTANTEFEVITGMSLEFFGPGEYPYITVLEDNTCETVNYVLKEHGFSTHAIHNHTATFYDRHKVYARLGFDTFTPIEYMQNISYNPLGWAKDTCLTDEIMKALNSTYERDMIYTISVQGHGKYPNERVIENPRFEIINGIEEDKIFQYEFFIEQIKEMDEFLEELIIQLKNFNEPVVLVLYGDHLPALEIGNKMLDNGDIYQTEYIIWDNFGLEKKDKDVTSYQLYSLVLERLGIEDGAINKLHQNKKNIEKYKEELKMLEYDILYGDKVIYGGKNPYEPTKIHMGIDKIKIDFISEFKDTIYVYGENFTKWSTVYINGKKRTTRFIDNGVVAIDKSDIKDGDVVAIYQIASDRTILGTSEGYVYNEK